MLKLKLFYLFLSLFVTSAGAKTVLVKSLAELAPYLDDDKVDVRLAAGTYWIKEKDLKKDYLQKETNIVGRKSRSLLLFEGNGSTYDFTGVTIKVETAVFKAAGRNHKVYEVHTVGNDNVIKNLTLEDVGEIGDNPAKGANSIVMDGKGNRIEGFNVSITGSFPYGYGDIFGKGGGPVISHRKHSACLVRGDSNHVKGCKFKQTSYGHCIYFQAANDPFIEDCYIEGELRTTDEVLAEKGTDSPADKVDFKTVWGHELKPGWTLSAGESVPFSAKTSSVVLNSPSM